MSQLRKSITFFLTTVLIAVSFASQAADIAQSPISSTNPGLQIPVGTENAIYPDKEYSEYGTDGKPLRQPLPFAESQCTQGACHYPTNRWFTDLMFYAKNRNGVGEIFAVAQSPYDISTFDDTTLIKDQPYALMLPGLYVRFNLPTLKVSKVEKPYQYNLNGDMYYPYLANDPTSHFVLTTPFQIGTKPETTRKIIYFDPLTFTTQWTLNNLGGGSMTSPIVRGSPYVTMEYNNMPVTLRTYQNDGFFAISADNHPPVMIEEGQRFTGKTFRFMITVRDFSYGDKQKGDAYPIRYFEYILFASSPITFEFAKRPIGDPAFVLQTVNNQTGVIEKFSGIIRIAYAGAETVQTTDLAIARQAGLAAMTNHKFATSEKMLSDYANVYPTGVDIKLSADNQNGQVIFDWKTKRMDGSPSNPSDPILMMAFEKNQLPYLIKVTQGDPNYHLTTLRGTMVPVIGESWALNVPFSTELSDNNLWHGSKPIPAALKPELQAALTSDIAWLQKPFAYPRPAIYISARNDSYAFGKQVARIARLALIADALGDTASRDIALGKIKEALSLWFPKTEPSNDKIGAKQSYMRYDDKFGGIVTARAASSPDNCQYDGTAQKNQCGYNLDFYNGQYTDHHFHYGYFLYAAAVLAKYDGAWLEQYKESINLLARDIANPSSQDPYFTPYRYFDWFEGHAFANGLVPGGDGRNQESTSEGINAWYGLTMWGNVTNNSSLANIGRIMTMLEARAAQTWTQITPGSGKSVYDEFQALANTQENPQNVSIKMSDLIVSGINWSLKVDHTTFFGLIKSYLIGIQLMPYTPISSALISMDWVSSNNTAGKNILADAVDNLVTRIKYFQDVSSSNSIFNKFLEEWNDFHTRYPNIESKDYWVQFAGRLNGSYQWGLNAIPTLALVDPNTTYQYTAFNTNGLFFTEMQKVNDAFYQAALSKSGPIIVKGVTDGRTCQKNTDNCYQLSGVEGDFGWPLAQLNYDGIDKGETVTSLLWWDFINKKPDAQKNPPALFWLYDDPKTENLTGSSALISWEPAKIINGDGTLKYTVAVKGKTICETESTSCQLTGLTPSTNYVASITATEKTNSLKSVITGQPAYITTYLQFLTLTANMTSFLRFDGPISKEKTGETSVNISWNPALLCHADDPNSCQASNTIGYEIKSIDEKTLCNPNSDTHCELTELDPKASYTIAVLAKDNAGHAQEKRLYLTFQINDEPVVPVIEWSKQINITPDNDKASATVTWDAASGISSIRYFVTLDGNKIYEGATPQALLLEQLSQGTHEIKIVVSDPSNSSVIPVTASQNFKISKIIKDLAWTGSTINGGGTIYRIDVNWSAATVGDPILDKNIQYEVALRYDNGDGTQGVYYPPDCRVTGKTSCIQEWPDPGATPITYILEVGASYNGVKIKPLVGTLTIKRP